MVHDPSDFAGFGGGGVFGDLGRGVEGKYMANCFCRSIGSGLSSETILLGSKAPALSVPEMTNSRLQ